MIDQGQQPEDIGERRMSLVGPGCVKTSTSDLRVELLSRLGEIRKERLCQSPSKEEKRENNSAHSLRVHVFTQPGPEADIPDRNLLPQNVLGSSTVPIGKRVGAARPQFTPIWPRIAEAAALVGEELSSSCLSG